MSYPQIWITNETPPRELIVKGRSAIDPDCLVAFVEGTTTNPLWIVESGGYVCDRDLGIKDVYAHNTAPPKPKHRWLTPGRHNKWRQSQE